MKSTHVNRYIYRLSRIGFVVGLLAVTLFASLYLSGRTPARAAGAFDWPDMLQAHKYASSGIVVGDQPFTYTIELRNMGEAATVVTITDPLPLAVSYLPGTATGDGVYDSNTHTLAWSSVTITPGVEVHVSFGVTATMVTAPKMIVNVAHIARGAIVLERSALVMIVPGSMYSPDLEHSYKMASRPVVAPGDPITYTIALVNRSPVSATANVTDPVPSQLTYVDGSADNGGVYDPGTATLTWNNIAVPAFSRVPLSFVATAPGAVVSPTFVINVATIATGDQQFERRAFVVVLDQPVPPPRPMLGGSYKAASRRVVASGQSLTYTINLINSGTAEAIVDVSDPVPGEMNYVLDSASNDGVYDPSTQLLAWSAITVPAGTSLPLTFAVTATTDVTRPVLVANTATITVENAMSATMFHDGVLLRKAFVRIVPSPSSDDVIPPVVHSLTIDEQDVLTSPTVTLHISATDNISVSQMFIREWELTSLPAPHWQVSQSSGWLPYQADYPWALGDRSGTHFVGVWVMDAAHNISHLARRAFDSASLLLPDTTVAQHRLVPYLVYYDQGVSVTAMLTPTSGDADLYVWHPGSYFRPDHKATLPLTGTDTITFTTPRAGLYLFVVYGYTDATYDLSIEPGGGPRGWMPWTDAMSLPDATGSDAPLVKPDELTYNAVLPDSGLDPLASSAAPDALYAIFLPMVVK